MRFLQAPPALLLVTIGLIFGFQPSPLAGQFPTPSPGLQAPAKPPAKQSLTVIIIAGANATNILRQKEAVAPMVEVRDQDNRPVVGAVVEFSVLDSEAGVTFLNSRRSFSAVTESDGRASAPCVPIGVGAFQIDVAATYAGLSASATIAQTNYKTPADVTRAGLAMPSQPPVSNNKTQHHGLSTGAVVGIAVAVAGAVGLGVYFGLHHGSSGSSVGVGSPTAGAPHLSDATH